MRFGITLFALIIAFAVSSQGIINPPKRPIPPKKQEQPSKKTYKGVSAPTGTINGYGYVDLGLPSGTKWAACNIGASSPEHPGGYYSWGETTTKSDYNSDTKAYNRGTATLISEGIIDSDGILTSQYDAATSNWGESWRMPHKREFQELKDKCQWTEVKQGECQGYKVTGPNGKSIFLPSAGYMYHQEKSDPEDGFYWGSGGEHDYESVVNVRIRYDGSNYVEHNGHIDIDVNCSIYGCLVRPVVK